MYRFSYRITEVLIIISFVLFSHPASPQSGDSTAQAKQHYQNAVAAIGKSDWQTAKNELLQAEKLAPQNALVHYDLALAYSHTGQIKSAQVELTSALQLGLPAEQKQAAAELKRKLATASNAPGSILKTKHVPSFTFETSTGKLWWSRLTGTYCSSGSVLGEMGARLSELDPDAISAGTDKDGESVLKLTCKNNSDCFEDWASSACTPINSYTHSHDDSVEVINKTIKQDGVETPLMDWILLLLATLTQQREP